nr:glutathione binding-like protein [Sphingomonas sp. CDS-1]
MIEFFGGSAPNPLKVLIAMEELKLAYNTNNLDFLSGALKTPAYLAINPNAKIPAIVDSEGVDGTPMPLAESGAILWYLAEKHGKFIPTDLKERYATLQWLMFQMSAIGPMFGQYVYFTRRVENQPHGVERYTTEVLRLYDVLESRLSQSRFLACDEYTVADIATFPAMAYVKVTGLDWSHYPNITRWRDEIAARPAVIRAREVLGHLDLDDKIDFTPDQWDRLFNRGKYSRASEVQTTAAE